MSAGIVQGKDQMFSVGQKTWHGMELFRTSVDTSAEALTLSGAKPAKLVKLSAHVDGKRVDVPDRRGIVIEGDSDVLGIVSDHYHLLQPVEAFDWFDTLVQEGKATYETAGTLKGQRIVWILAKLTETFKVGRNDLVKPYIFLTDSRDASQSIRAALVNERVVCANTHAIAMREGGIGIRHTRSYKEKLEEAKRVLGLATDQFRAQVEAYNHLATADSPTVQAVSDYLASLIPLAPEPGKGDKKAQESWEVTREHVVRDRNLVIDLYGGRAVGADLAGKTWWGLFNASTEWVDHYRQPTASVSSRFYSSQLGTGQAIKSKAFTLALAGAGS